MLVDIRLKENKIEVEFSDELLPIQVYDIEKEVNFTELVKIISDIDENLIINPSNFGEWKGIKEHEDERIVKVGEYIYKILNAYIKSFNEVCPEIVEEVQEEKSA